MQLGTTAAWSMLLAMPFSVVICCANVADTLEAACRSVAWADEILVVDSGSSDGTAEIAQRLAERYVLEPWRGYTQQKKFGAELCRNDWVLVLDGDEECSPALAAQLQALSAQELERHDLFLVRRRNYVMGRPVRAWWPDHQNRIIHRRRCDWSQEVLHDARHASDPRRVGRLNGWLEHKRHSAAGFGDYFSGRRMDERLLLVARQMHARVASLPLVGLGAAPATGICEVLRPQARVPGWHVRPDDRPEVGGEHATQIRGPVGGAGRIAAGQETHVIVQVSGVGIAPRECTLTQTLHDDSNARAWASG